MTIKTPPRRYRIFPAYINGEGHTVASGEYYEYEINLNEARQRSTAILINASDFQEIKPTTAAPDISFVASNDVSFQNVPTIAVVNRLKINTASIEDIASIKFVGKVAAAKIIEARKDAKISTYEQLDKITPIKGHKNWQDIAVIDFELPDPTLGLVYEGLKTFGYSQENINAISKPLTN